MGSSTGQKYVGGKNSGNYASSWYVDHLAAGHTLIAKLVVQPAYQNIAHQRLAGSGGGETLL